MNTILHLFRLIPKAVASLLLATCLLAIPSHAAGGGAGHSGETNAINFPQPESDYTAMEVQRALELGRELGLIERLKLRAAADPFNAIGTLIFLLAVTHTFMASKFNKMAHRFEAEHRTSLSSQQLFYVEGKEPVSFKATLFHFLGEVEAIFGIWLIPLLASLVLMQPDGLSVVAFYIDTRNYTEPIFVVVIMTIASSRPVVQFAETCMCGVASLGKKTPSAWWLAILIVAPLLGSLITEPAAMTIAALLLGQQFYQLKPSPRFKYATLGLLFVNISVGGTLTHFAAPPVLMVADTWHWNLPMMLTNFGWRAVLGIITSTVIYYFLFRRR